MGHYLNDFLPEDLDFDSCMTLASAARFMSKDELTNLRKKLVKETFKNREEMEGK